MASDDTKHLSARLRRGTASHQPVAEAPLPEGGVPRYRKDVGSSAGGQIEAVRADGAPSVLVRVFRAGASGGSRWRTVQVWGRRASLAIGTVSLSALTVFGASGTIQILRRTPSWSGLAQSLPQILCNALGVACIVTAFRFRRWQAPVLLAWVAACTFTASVVPVLRGGAGWLAAVSGGSAVLAVAGLIALVQRVGSPAVPLLRPDPAPAAAGAGVLTPP